MTFLGPAMIAAVIAVGLLSKGDCDEVARTDQSGVEWALEGCSSESFSPASPAHISAPRHPAPVPEPSVWILEIAGLACVGGAVRQLKSRNTFRKRWNP